VELGYQYSVPNHYIKLHHHTSYLHLIIITSSLLFIIIASYTHFTIVPDDTPVEALLGTVGGTEDATWAPSCGVAEEDHPGRHQGPYHTKVRERKGERRMVEGGSKVVGGHMVLIKYILPPSLLAHTHTTSPKSGGGGAAVCPHWQASLIALHMLTWLMLGAMCHNTIDTAALEMKMEGNVSGLCQLLGSLNTRMDVTTQGVINLATGVLERLAVSNEVSTIIIGRLS